MRKPIFGTFLLFVASIIVCTSPSFADQQTRQLSGPELGKCVFSTEVMPKNSFGHSAYSKVTTDFESGDPIAARCFYELGSQENYAALGRVANSMRDSGKYFAELEWTKPDGAIGSHSDFRIVAYKHNFRNDWDQQRYDLTSDFAECDFKLKGDEKRKFGAKSDGCMNFDKFTHLQSKKLKVSVPESPEFCVRIFMNFANSESIRTIGGQVQKIPDYVEKTMARGCFNVNLSNAEFSDSQTSNDIEVTHGIALQNIDKACAGMPFGNPTFCECYKSSAISAGLGSFSSQAANVWSIVTLNPGAFSAEERQSALMNASEKARAEAASSDLSMIAGTMLSECQSVAFGGR